MRIGKPRPIVVPSETAPRKPSRVRVLDSREIADSVKPRAEGSEPKPQTWRTFSEGKPRR